MVCLAFTFSQASIAQVDFGVKAGINYNNNGDATFSSTSEDVVSGGDSKSGFHAGVWFRGKLPLVGLYIRPEIVYTQVKNEYTDKRINQTTDYEYQKIDVPVLIGKKFLGVANAFIGPSFQYIIDDSFEFGDLTADEFDQFSVGLQMGVGVELGRLGIDVRWERGLSNTEAKFANNVTVDNRTDQIIFGLSLEL